MTGTGTDPRTSKIQSKIDYLLFSSMKKHVQESNIIIENGQLNDTLMKKRIGRVLSALPNRATENKTEVDGRITEEDNNKLLEALEQHIQVKTKELLLIVPHNDATMNPIDTEVISQNYDQIIDLSMLLCLTGIRSNQTQCSELRFQLESIKNECIHKQPVSSEQLDTQSCTER